MSTAVQGSSSTSAVAQFESATEEQHQDLTFFVQNLLKEMQSRFQSMSDGIVNRIDDMGSRIDDLEKCPRVGTPQDYLSRITPHSISKVQKVQFKLQKMRDKKKYKEGGTWGNSDPKKSIADLIQ